MRSISVSNQMIFLRNTVWIYNFTLAKIGMISICVQLFLRLFFITKIVLKCLLFIIFKLLIHAFSSFLPLKMKENLITNYFLETCLRENFLLLLINYYFIYYFITNNYYYLENILVPKKNEKNFANLTISTKVSLTFEIRFCFWIRQYQGYRHQIWYQVCAMSFFICLCTYESNCLFFNLVYFKLYLFHL